MAHARYTSSGTFTLHSDGMLPATASDSFKALCTSTWLMPVGVRVGVKTEKIAYSPLSSHDGELSLRFKNVVPGARVELARSYEQRILSPLCLPFHHPGVALVIIHC